MSNLPCVLLAAILFAANMPANGATTISDDVEATDKKGTKKEDESTGDKTARAAQFPNAARLEPIQKGTESLATIRNKMTTAFQKAKPADALDVIAAADNLKMNEKANPYDKAIANQIKATVLGKSDPGSKEIIPLIEELLELNALDNNTHYSFMLELAQRYLIAQDYEDALALSNRFLIETKKETETALAVNGNSLYRLGKPQEAILVLEKVRALNPANLQVLQMLSRAYSETGQTKKASEISKDVAQSSGNDRASMINLAISYRDAKDYAAAADLIADLRARKQLVEERDYLVAMNIYTGMKNREDDTIAVLEEGLQKGALPVSAKIYNILAEAYYYSNQENNIKNAIATWGKAAPLAKDGVSYLNLAIVQCQEQMWVDCKNSAKNAISKGGINAGDAKKQIAMADAGMNQAK
jgi:hypothetical protein